MNEYIWVYITYPDKEGAIQLATTLVHDMILACANIINGVTSIYSWEGKINQDAEVIIIGKTQKKNFTVLQKKVEELHPYQCPCIISLPIELGNQQYLQWITDQSSYNKS